MKAKSPDESRAETTVLMMPPDANPMGNVFGGVILKHVDLIAGIVAKRHAGHGNIVTATMDRMTFMRPVFIGNALVLSARINYVRRSSMEVEVTVDSENFDEGARVRTGTAFVTLVALDKRGKATEVPQLLLKTKEENKRFEDGKKRMERRLHEAGKL
ncbi:acyl-CoA thioesterase [Candidatus Nitrososphaera sp. FF02]|uniref:acyl-CoA thioesterase n=1 Tax=Candidatus Nitrososphaera sp. FF02 TaxID=3398226 RepID=UPI0039EA1352